MKKTLKDCPVHGHGANGLGCYCEKKDLKYRGVLRRDGYKIKKAREAVNDEG